MHGMTFFFWFLVFSSYFYPYLSNLFMNWSTFIFSISDISISLHSYVLSLVAFRLNKSLIYWFINGLWGLVSSNTSRKWVSLESVELSTLQRPELTNLLLSSWFSLGLRRSAANIFTKVLIRIDCFVLSVSYFWKSLTNSSVLNSY